MVCESVIPADSGVGGSQTRGKARRGEASAVGNGKDLKKYIYIKIKIKKGPGQLRRGTRPARLQHFE
jgi:hypothetical protein